MPFGSMDNLDGYDQYFSPNTDFMLELGDRRPLLYLHGYTPRKRPMKHPVQIGPPAVFSKVDSQGGWMEAELYDNNELADRAWNDVLAGRARASTGSVEYLVRPRPVTNREGLSLIHI